MPFPVLHELTTGVQAAVYAIGGQTKKAEKVLMDYGNESMIGSTVLSAVSAIGGDHEAAEKYIKGAGRSTGQSLFGAGLLSDVPVFRELSKCGKSLGDAMTGDIDSAQKRWTEEYVNEISSPASLLKGVASLGVAVGGAAACIATAGLATPAVIGASAAIGAVGSAAENAIGQGIDVALDSEKKEFDACDLISSGISGAVTGAALSALSEGISAGRAKSSTSHGNDIANKSSFCRDVNAYVRDPHSLIDFLPNDAPSSSSTVTVVLEGRLQGEEELFVSKTVSDVSMTATVNDAYELIEENFPALSKSVDKLRSEDGNPGPNTRFTDYGVSANDEITFTFEILPEISINVIGKRTGTVYECVCQRDTTFRQFIDAVHCLSEDHLAHIADAVGASATLDSLIADIFPISPYAHEINVGTA